MAIIQCPACGERISSAATDCSQCGVAFGDDEAAEKLERQARNLRFKKKAQLQNYSFLAMVAFAAGALLMYFGMGENDDLYQDIGRFLVAFGFISYIVLRASLMWMKWR
jgi:hypothetical protein